MTQGALAALRFGPCVRRQVQVQVGAGPDLGALDEHAPPQRVLRAQRLVHLVQPRRLPAAPAAT